jgi:hypothetical protein
MKNLNLTESFKDLEIDEQAKNIAGLTKISNKLTNLEKASTGAGKKVKGRATLQTAEEAKLELENVVINEFKITKDLLNKSTQELEKLLVKEINVSLKNGVKIGVTKNLPDNVKEISRTLAAKDILSKNRNMGVEEIKNIVNSRVESTLKKYQRSETNLLKKGTSNNAPAPSPNTPSGGKSITSRITDALLNAGRIAKGSKIVKYVLVAGAVGVAGYALYAYLSDGSKIKLEDKDSEEVKKLLNPCLLPLLSNGGTIVPVADGAQLQLKKTGNSEADSKGGVVYYPNGRAWTLDNSKKGTWSCSEIINETMKPVTLKEAIRFRLKNLLNEQVDYDITINGVNIKWDKSTSSSTQPKQQMTYKLKKGFNYYYGDKSEDIRKIQEKLGFEVRYITGNFGPITKSKLEALGYDLSNGITKEIYDQIMGTDSKSQPSSGEEKQTQNTIPYSKPESSFQNKVVSGAFNDLNVKKDTIGTTQTGTTSTDTTEPKPQPINSDRDVIIKNLRRRKINGDIVYRGNSLDQSDEQFLLNYINEKYGENGKFKFVVKRNTEKAQKGEDVIVYEKSRNK